MTRIRLQGSTAWPPGHATRINSGVVITHHENSDYSLGGNYFFKNECTDETDKTKDNPLLITQTNKTHIDPLNGFQTVAPGSTREFVNYYPPTQAAELSHSPASIPSIGAVALATLARTNPSRALVSVPNFVYELKDLPGMIRDIGRLKLLYRNRKFLADPVKESANYWLSYQMGWKPLIGDLRKLLDFQAVVDRKMRDLEGLYRNGGISRRFRSPQFTGVSETRDTQVLASGITSDVTCRRTRYTKIERWGTVRWYPAQRPGVRYSDQELARKARDLAFGMRFSSKAVWDAIPWTWLLAWFSNVDDFVQAYDNAIPTTHSMPCVMTKTETVYTWTRSDSASWCTGGNSTSYLTTKKRDVNVSGSLSASIPFLGARQLSILGALNIQRFKR